MSRYSIQQLSDPADGDREWAQEELVGGRQCWVAVYPIGVLAEGLFERIESVLLTVFYAFWKYAYLQLMESLKGKDFTQNLKYLNNKSLTDYFF